MDPVSPSCLTELFRRYSFRPKKRLGQNFLIDHNILTKILDAAEIGEGDSILEIGPGVGALTIPIAQRGATIIAIELDCKLAEILRELTANLPKVHIVNCDFLSLNLSAAIQDWFGNTTIKMVGNLPYYITSPIITKVLQPGLNIDRAVFMIQKEVAERLTASPGTKNYGAMSVYTQYHSSIEIVTHVSRNVFFPPPEVSSTIITLRPRSSPPVEVSDPNLFFSVVRHAFHQRRKTLLNTLAGTPELGILKKEEAAHILEVAGIEPTRRPETLSLAEFATVAHAIATSHKTNPL